MRAQNVFWVWLAVTTSGSVVHAHVSLDAPPSRYYQSSSKQADQNKLKTSPCGASGDARTTNASLVTTFKPGETITVTWRETVQHPGHFRIAFDNDGQDFPFPGGDPLPNGVVVLVDNIPDRSGANGLTYSQEVTLPNLECNNCTLQLIQVMTTASPPYSKSGDLYFNCADLILKSTGSTSAGGASSGGATGSLPGAGGTAARGGAGSASGGIASSASAANGGRGSLALGGNASRGGSNETSSAPTSNGGGSSFGGAMAGGATNHSSSNGGATGTTTTLSGGTSQSNSSSGGSTSGALPAGGASQSIVASTLESSGGSRNSASPDNTTSANANGGAQSATSGNTTSSNATSSNGGGTDASTPDGTQNGTNSEAPGCTCRLSGDNHTGRAATALGLGLLWLARRKPRRREATK